MSFILSSFSRFAYSIVYFLLLPFVLLRLLIRSLKAPAYRKRIIERLGFFTRPSFLINSKQPILIHAVSVGENVAVLPVIKKLLERDVSTPIVLTCSTPTGSAQIKKSLAKEISEGQVFHVYLPYDLPIFLNQFFKRLNPKIVLMVETELWPNLLSICKKNNIKTALINARLSEKSFKSYAKLNTLVSEMLSNLDFILAQDESSAKRFVSLGLSKSNIKVVGNIKFDLHLDETMLSNASAYKTILKSPNQAPLLIAASTHAGEDEIIFQAFNLLLTQLTLSGDSELLPRLVVVPRHPERFSDVAALSESMGFKTKLFSDLMKMPSPILEVNEQVIMVDQMGVLLPLFGAVDIAFVGGSLLSSLGGHNVIEPAAWNVPVLSGPFMQNFQQISDQLIDAGGLKLVNNAEELVASWHTYLNDKGLLKKAGDAAKKYQLENQGAIEKSLNELSKYL